MTTKIYDETILITDPTLQLTVTAEKRKDKRLNPPFTAVGRSYQKGLDSNRDKIMVGYPFISVLLAFNKGEQWFYGLLHSELDYTNNIAQVLSSSLSKSDLPKMSKAFKSLCEKGLVKRVRKELYIVNPDAVIQPTYYEAIKKKWDSLP